MIEVEINIAADSDGIKKLLAEAQFKGEKTIVDVYYDNQDFSLTCNDIWLRQRNDKFEMKVPLNVDTIDKRTSDQYDELVDESAIRDRLGIKGNNALETDMENSGYKPFGTLITQRKEYVYNEFTIDMDTMDFDFTKGEIELMVDSTQKIPDAESKILALMSKYEIPVDYTYGKVIQFIKRNNPVHLQKND